MLVERNCQGFSPELLRVLNARAIPSAPDSTGEKEAHDEFSLRCAAGARVFARISKAITGSCNFAHDLRRLRFPSVAESSVDPRSLPGFSHFAGFREARLNGRHSEIFHFAC